MNKGLPPGPINMPEARFIEAVLVPRQHDYLYFCAREDLSGYSNFARTYDQHLVNARRYQKALNAPASTGVLSAGLCHLANISARVGRTLTFDPVKVEIRGDEQANALVGRRYRTGHWAAPKA